MFSDVPSMPCTASVEESSPKSTICERERIVATLDGRKRLLAEIALLEKAYQAALARLVPEDADHLPHRPSDPETAEADWLHSMICQMRDDLSHCVEVPSDGAIVALGTCVSVLQHGRRQEMHIVGPMTANPLLGRISYLSPLGRALVGHFVGDSISLAGEYGSSHLKIVDVKGTTGEMG